MQNWARSNNSATFPLDSDSSAQFFNFGLLWCMFKLNLIDLSHNFYQKTKMSAVFSNESHSFYLFFFSLCSIFILSLWTFICSCHIAAGNIRFQFKCHSVCPNDWNTLAIATRWIRFQRYIYDCATKHNAHFSTWSIISCVHKSDVSISVFLILYFQFYSHWK